MFDIRRVEQFLNFRKLLVPTFIYNQMISNNSTTRNYLL